VAGASVAALLAVGAGAGIAAAQPNPNPGFVILATTQRNVVTDNNRSNAPTGSFNVASTFSLFNSNLINAGVTCNLRTTATLTPGILDTFVATVPPFGTTAVTMSGSLQSLGTFNTSADCTITTATTPGGVFAGPSSITFTPN